MRLTVTFVSFPSRITKLLLPTEESRIDDAVFAAGRGRSGVVRRRAASVTVVIVVGSAGGRGAGAVLCRRGYVCQGRRNVVWSAGGRFSARAKGVCVGFLRLWQGFALSNPNAFFFS